jgi:hypothetical protein
MINIAVTFILLTGKWKRKKNSKTVRGRRWGNCDRCFMYVIASNRKYYGSEHFQREVVHEV